MLNSGLVALNCRTSRKRWLKDCSSWQQNRFTHSTLQAHKGEHFWMGHWVLVTAFGDTSQQQKNRIGKKTIARFYNIKRKPAKKTNPKNKNSEQKTPSKTQENWNNNWKTYNKVDCYWSSYIDFLCVFCTKKFKTKTHKKCEQPTNPNAD